MKFTVFGYTITFTAARAKPLDVPAELKFPRTSVVRLPRLIGSRENVQALFRSHQVPRSLVNTRLVVSGRDCVSMSNVVADEIVRQAISRKAPRLCYLGMTPVMVLSLHDAADRLGVLNPAFFIREIDPLDLPAQDEWVRE